MKKILTAVIIFLVGVGILIGGFFMVKSTVTFLNNSEKTEGTVSSIITSRSSDGDTMYSPEIYFTDTSGKTIIFKSNISSNVSSYQVGEKVAVLYDKNNSQSAKINTFFQL